jgi:N-acetyl-gamma-glutamylphosphate reductase
MKKRINVAILGAAGVLGQRFIERLENHPTFEIAALADIMLGKKCRVSSICQLFMFEPKTSVLHYADDERGVGQSSLSVK